MRHVTFEPVDARGVAVEPGALVVYGAGVGRSIAMVVARVLDEGAFTATGRVRLRVEHRAFGGWGGSAETVAVRPDRLVVVGSLPAVGVDQVLTHMRQNGEYTGEQGR